MQFQVQETISKKTDLDKNLKTQDDLDLFVGLKSGLDDPFNLFLRVSDLTNNSSLIYFYAYSLGKKKVAIWGVYDKNNSEFLIDSACKYSPNDLLQIVNTWKKNDYSYFLNSVRNRISPRMTQESLFNDRKKEQELFDNFKIYFLAKLVKMGLISSQNFFSSSKNSSSQNSSSQNETIDHLSKTETFDAEYNKILERISKVTSNAMSSKNFPNYTSILDTIYEEIDNKEDEMTLKSLLKFSFGKNRLLNKAKQNQNTYIENLAKYITVTLFIILFADMDIYRTAKYVQYLDDAKVKTYLKGSFFYHWCIELSKILGVYNVPKFMKRFTKSIVDIIEKDINMTSVASQKFNLIEIGNFFQEFLEKSIYTKASYSNNLPICPNIDSCDIDSKEECNLYLHGTKNSSKHDMT